jgi:hypothetical protein
MIIGFYELIIFVGLVFVVVTAVGFYVIRRRGGNQNSKRGL